MRHIFRPYWSAAILLLCFFGVNAHADPALQPEISYLLKKIADSHAVFIRNGNEYTSQEAKSHMENKLRFAGDRIHTADEFIAYIATGSSNTNKPYYVRFPSGKEIKTATWLRGLLDQKRAEEKHSVKSSHPY